MRTVKVYDATRSRGRCKYCGDSLMWYQTVDTARQLPFNDGSEPVRTEHDDDRQLIAVMDSSDSHLETCTKRPSRN
jgi:hypothetical protein